MLNSVGLQKQRVGFISAVKFTQRIKFQYAHHRECVRDRPLKEYVAVAERINELDKVTAYRIEHILSECKNLAEWLFGTVPAMATESYWPKFVKFTKRC